MYRKGNTGAQLSYQGHLLMENRCGLACDARLSLATGHGERDTALAMMGDLKGRRRRTLAADKGYDCWRTPKFDQAAENRVTKAGANRPQCRLSLRRQ